MSDTAESNYKKADEEMKKAINHLQSELLKIRAGKASPSIIDGINIDYYGSPTPIGQAANVTVTDARTLSIQPWEKNMLQEIEKAIMAANIGITPQNDGDFIKLYMPPLTEERRKEMSKKVFAEGEQAKISIRNIRRDAMEVVKDLKKDGMSEDQAKDAEDSIQSLTDDCTKNIDEVCKVKEKELMTI